jgi:FKBP-type peptidyl-prolyl cis-trans isomerase FkpA
LSVDTITAGEGPNPGENDVVFIDYVGTLEDGTEFDRSPPDLGLPPAVAAMVPEGVPMELSGVVPGFREALMQTQEGGKYEIFIPSDKGYGSSPPPGAPIPPDADLNFEVTVHKILTADEFQQLGMQVQMAMMQAQQEAQGAEGATPPPAQ